MDIQLSNKNEEIIENNIYIVHTIHIIAVFLFLFFEFFIAFILFLHHYNIII